MKSNFIALLRRPHAKIAARSLVLMLSAMLAPLALLPLLAQTAASPPVAPARPCVLEVHAVDASGRPIASAVFRVPGKTADLAAAVPHSLPCDTDLVTVKASGFKSKPLVFALAPGQHLEILQLDVDFMHSSGGFERMVTFTIDAWERYPHCGMVRVVSLLDPTVHWDSKISQRGIFSIEPMPWGFYSFLLLGNNGPCGVASHQISPNHPPEARLAFTTH